MSICEARDGETLLTRGEHGRKSIEDDAVGAGVVASGPALGSFLEAEDGGVGGGGEGGGVAGVAGADYYDAVGLRHFEMGYET